MKKPTRHLVLRRENIRTLAVLELRAVGGGGAEIMAMDSGLNCPGAALPTAKD